MSNDASFEGVVIVTGAGSGIGRAVALRFGRAGARVMVSDLDAASATATAAAITEGGGTAEWLATDVADGDQMRRLVEETHLTFGRVDHLANIAGYGPPPTPILDTPDEMFRRAFDVNIGGAWWGIRHFARYCREHGSGGSITSTASGTGIRVLPGSAAYGTSKAAIIHLTRIAAIELAEYGIRVNAISPGPTRTPGFASLSDDNEGWEQIVTANIPMRRLASPEEIADGALWLASPAASYVTGIVLPIDGGETAK